MRGKTVLDVGHGGFFAYDPASASTVTVLDVSPAKRAAKVVINSRTGTMVISSAVRLAPAAISHGSLVVRIDENPQIVQPAPFGNGQTAQSPAGYDNIEGVRRLVQVASPALTPGTP